MRSNDFVYVTVGDCYVSDSIASICCGFVVQLAVQHVVEQIHNKYTANGSNGVRHYVGLRGGSRKKLRGSQVGVKGTYNISVFV